MLWMAFNCNQALSAGLPENCWTSNKQSGKEKNELMSIIRFSVSGVKGMRYFLEKI